MSATVRGVLRLVGASYDLSKSRFAFGSTPVKDDANGFVRWVGAHGVVAIQPSGGETGIMNAGAPEPNLPDWSDDPTALAKHVTDYFVAMGALTCQDDGEALVPERRGTYRPWAELLKRTFDFDVLQCPSCGGRMKLLALVTAPKSIARYLRAAGEPTDVPRRSPSRGPSWWKSTILRRKALGDVA